MLPTQDTRICLSVGTCFNHMVHCDQFHAVGRDLRMLSNTQVHPTCLCTLLSQGPWHQVHLLLPRNLFDLVMVVTMAMSPKL